MFFVLFQQRARRTSAQKAHVTMVKSRERRKERMEAKRRQEESNNTNVAEQGMEQTKRRQSIDNDAPDTKPAAVELNNCSDPQSNSMVTLGKRLRGAGFPAPRPKPPPIDLQ